MQTCLRFAERTESATCAECAKAFELKADRLQVCQGDGVLCDGVLCQGCAIGKSPVLAGIAAVYNGVLDQAARETKEAIRREEYRK